MNRTALLPTAFLMALLVSAVAGTQLVSVALANPFFIFEAATPIPGTIPPTISISAPVNDTSYSPNQVHVSFSTSKPQTPTPLETGIIKVKYSLDNSSNLLYYCTQYSSGSPPGIPEFNYSDNVTVAEGDHEITVFSVGIVFPTSSTCYTVNSTATVFFAAKADPAPATTPISTTSPSPSPSLAASTPTASPSEPPSTPSSPTAEPTGSIEDARSGSGLGQAGDAFWMVVVAAVAAASIGTVTAMVVRKKP
jgi:hypothetical protein